MYTIVYKLYNCIQAIIMNNYTIYATHIENEQSQTSMQLTKTDKKC